MEISLTALPPRLWGTVTHIGVPEALEARLTSFGLVPGTKLSPRYLSPDGSVTAVELRGTILALRTKDVKKIWVKI